MRKVVEQPSTSVKRPELGLAFCIIARMRESVPAVQVLVRKWMMYFIMWMLYFLVMCPVFVYRPGQAVPSTAH